MAPARCVFFLCSKVTDFLHRMEDDGEPMSAASMFSEADEEALFGLDCWVDFATTNLAVLQDEMEEGSGADDGQQTIGSRHGSEASTDGGPTIVGSDNDVVDELNGLGEEGKDEAAAERINRSDCAELLEEATRRKATEAVLTWLRSIDSELVGKCAEVCDAAWYDLGETITYKGRPVAHRLPARAMEAAAQRREDREEGG